MYKTFSINNKYYDLPVNLTYDSLNMLKFFNWNIEKTSSTKEEELYCDCNIFECKCKPNVYLIYDFILKPF